MDDYDDEPTETIAATEQDTELNGDDLLPDYTPQKTVKSDDMSFLDGLVDGRGQVNDEAIRSISVPPSFDKYELVAGDVGNAHIEPPMLKDFQKFCHEDKVPQGEYAKVVHFTLEDYESEAEAQIAFKEFCQENNISRERAEKYVKFYNQQQKDKGERIALRRRRSGMSESSAAEMDSLTRHPAYFDKHHENHKKVMKRIHQIGRSK